MKKCLMYGWLLAGAALASCQYTELIDPVNPDKGRDGKTRMQVTIEDITGGIPLVDGSTRAIVDPLDAEKNVTSLNLLFFTHSNDGSGVFVKNYVVDPAYLDATYVEDTDPSNPSRYIDGEPFELEIGTGQGDGLSHLEHYSILAYANLTLPDMTGKTETQARDAILTIDYGTEFKQGSNLALPMSGTTTKEPEQELVTLKLTRMVSRFDVKNELPGYTLKSVQLWNAATKTRVWGGGSGLETVPAAEQVYTSQQSPGPKQPAYSVSASGTQMLGGLYGFENFIGNPAAERDHTTALLIGLEKGSEGVLYHRVNVHPLDEGQNLKKNHVYQLTLKGVISGGKSQPEDAMNDEEPSLDVTINNWGPEADEGLILNDGTNMLVAPTRYIRFGEAPERREYLIYTSGTGTLEITRRDLPNGITASLNGNTLIVEVEALPEEGSGYQEERSGTIELGFVGLRGSIHIIQSPEDDYFLNLDKKSLPLWDFTGGAGQTITVSSSGPWTAKIYNTSEDPTNPGFKFVGGVTDYEASGDNTDTITVVPTGANPSNSARQGFVIVTLTVDSKYRQVLVLMQEGTEKMEIYPNYDPAKGLPFNAGGFAKLVGNGATEKFYRIDVRPGKDNNGDLNEWMAELTGPHAAYFNLTPVKDPVAPYVVISAKGQVGTTPGNPTNPGLNVGGALETLLAIKFPGGTTAGGSAIELPVTQDPMVFTVKRTGAHTRVPVMGLYDHVANKLPGTPGADDITGYVEYSVDMPPGLTWEAEIIEQSLPNSDSRAWKRHEGFFLTDNNERVTTLTNQASDKKLRVSFDKIYYPMVHWPNTPSGVVNSPNAEDYNIPRVTIAINVTDFEAGKPISFATELMTEQVPLTAKPVDILNIYGGATATTEVGGAYGAINNLNADNTYFYMYSQALQAASYFSQTGWVRTPRANTKVGGESITDMSAGSTWVGNPSINVERNYIHASGFNRTWTETSLRRVEQWRTSAETDGFVFFVSDEVGAISLNGVASLGPWNMYGAGGLEPGGYTLTSQTGANSESLYAPSANTRIMKYVLNGPFGTTPMESLNNAFAHDAIYSYAQTETITEQNPNAVILIKERNSLSNGHDHTLLVVDPTQRLAYAGEGQLFNNFGAIASTLGTNDITYPAKRIFRGNFMSIFINSAMYGSHFYDLLRDDCPEEFWVIRNTSAGTTPAATYSVNQID